MAKRNVIWTRTADLQFVGILEYWVKRNKSATYSFLFKSQSIAFIFFIPLYVPVS